MYNSVSSDKCMQPHGRRSWKVGRKETLRMGPAGWVRLAQEGKKDRTPGNASFKAVGEAVPATGLVSPLQ